MVRKLVGGLQSGLTRDRAWTPQQLPCIPRSRGAAESAGRERELRLLRADSGEAVLRSILS